MIALVVLIDTQSLQRLAGHGERNRCHQALRNSQWWTACWQWRTCSPAAFSRAGRLAREELVGDQIAGVPLAGYPLPTDLPLVQGDAGTSAFELLRQNSLDADPTALTVEHIRDGLHGWMHRQIIKRNR